MPIASRGGLRTKLVKSSHDGGREGVDLVLVPIWAVKRPDHIIARIHTSADTDYSMQGRERCEWIALRREDGRNLNLDCVNLTAEADGAHVELSMRGFLLVEHLIRAARVVPPRELKTVVWGSEQACSDPTLRGAIHHIRKALPQPGSTA